MSASEDVLNASAQGRLKSIVERIERLEEDMPIRFSPMTTTFRSGG